MSTTAELIAADLKEYSARRQRYWQSSSLSTREKIKHRCKLKSYRRDRVLYMLMDINMKAAVSMAKVEAQHEEGTSA
ncbi:TPA: hypothetical protein ACNU9R_002518 [Citrobacter freundii]